ncbi:helix-turn-helix transcriptional regulator [Halarchaeum salinum]|uniref:Uncharacterized protein n=1 Tax=Halarchaeum salinum TaxID=489912 RepID=A0AAV3S7X0_9EURY
MRVRAAGDWMTVLDERLLEELRRDDYITLGTLAARVPRPAPQYRVAERLRVLAQAGYVEPERPDRGKWWITYWGQLYLDGEARADCIYPEPSPARPGYVLR